jgi:hypothetical protein
MLLLQTLRGIDGRDETLRTFDLFGGGIKIEKGKMNEKGKKIEMDFIFLFIIIYSFSPFEARSSSLFISLFYHSRSLFTSGWVFIIVHLRTLIFHFTFVFIFVIPSKSLKNLIPLGNPPPIKAASAQLTPWGRERRVSKWRGTGRIRRRTCPLVDSRFTLVRSRYIFM